MSKCTAKDITLSMLAYLFLIKVAALTQSNSLSALFPYVNFSLTTGMEHWHSSICWLSSIRSLSTFKCYYLTASEATPLGRRKGKLRITTLAI